MRKIFDLRPARLPGPRVVTVAALPRPGPRGALCAGGGGGAVQHPLGKAVVAGYRGKPAAETDPATAFDMLPGRGASADVDGAARAGGQSAAALAEGGVDVHSGWGAAKASGGRLHNDHVAVDGAFAGYLALSDTLRESAATVRRWRRRACGLLLTSDHGARGAKLIARARLGIREVRARCRPEEKLEKSTAGSRRASACA